MVMWSLIPEREELRIRMKVSEIMNRNIVTMKPEGTVYEAAKLMKENNIGSIVVMEEGKLRGIVTERDLITRYIAMEDGRRPEEVRISEIMTDDPITIRDNADIDEAARVMIENNIRRLIVVNYDGKVVGIVSSRDILRIAPHIWFLLLQELRIAQSRVKWGLV